VNTGELRELSVEELRAKSRELRGELFNVKIKQATGQLESTAKLRELRRQIARAETILRQRSGAEQ
jgi:large subunit ribosomal protein L29